MITLLHTSPAHIPVFDALRDAHHPGVELRHLVHEDLLARAREAGPQAVAEKVRDVVAGAARDGAHAVLCTCSTIGAVAEEAAAGVPVLRVDRPMAAEAVRSDAIVVVATVASTLAPTFDLIADEALRAGRTPRVRTVLVEGAFERFSVGDLPGSLELVDRAVAGIRAAGDETVVLAQVSLAGAAGAGVLASPRGGLAAAVAAAAGAAVAPGRPNG
ncbi:arylsulfatase [Streptomyces sp. NPDC060194]|uniref:arylsulfatase n=1 Tax=Streptomyces sp. NPDC060194 TaxID=3347069 RepID=UPI00366118DB